MELGGSQLFLIKMILGHGIDIEELASIQNAVKKREGFAQRVLTDKELKRFASLKGRRQIEYLAGRWSAKEAFSKAMGTGIGKLGFQDLEILNNERGAPYFSKSPFSGKVWLSISHTDPTNGSTHSQRNPQMGGCESQCLWARSGCCCNRYPG